MEPYRLEGLIRETVEDDILEEDINPLTNFVSDLLGSNPRAYKRMANSFFLMKSVNEALQKTGDPQLDNVLIFGSLCIQMCVPKFYQLLVSVSDEKEKKNVFRCLNSFNEFLTDIQKNHKNAKQLPSILGCDPSVKISEKDFNRLMDMAQASGTLEKLNEIYDRELEHMQGS